MPIVTEEEATTGLLMLYKQVEEQISHIPKTQRRVIDVGCGSGVRSLRLAEALGATSLTLIDIQNQLEIDQDDLWSFDQVDLASPQFREKYYGTHDIVMCNLVFHEIDPVAAVAGLMSAVCHGGIIVIVDNNERGWQINAENMHLYPANAQAHYLRDKAKIEERHLERDVDIKAFWDNVEYGVPGDLVYQNIGGIYTVLYLARQWGEIKELPPEFK